ncbi:hypothetical protein HYC85_013918 [Camellia sinensis]|uniref:beta-galactosidase n=1 Tax=Camellia sinensis TaxID=4442 RepID=A0A7J7H6S8_CAMSI|nr:hypothetical protein HYC85_013918 [Camellia sinensis]
MSLEVAYHLDLKMMTHIGRWLTLYGTSFSGAVTRQSTTCVICAKWENYHGGTNFGRTTGGPFIATSYDYDAPIDECGLLRQPKWGHLKDAHKAIKLCEPAMAATGPTITSLGSNLEVQVISYLPGLSLEGFGL